MAFRAVFPCWLDRMEGPIGMREIVAVVVEELAEELVGLVSYGAKPDWSIVLKCPVFYGLVKAVYPKVEKKRLPAMMCHELRGIFDSDSPEDRASRQLWRIADGAANKNAEEARAAAVLILHAQCSTQTWRKHRELAFMRERAWTLWRALSPED